MFIFQVTGTVTDKCFVILFLLLFCKAAILSEITPTQPNTAIMTLRVRTFIVKPYKFRSQMFNSVNVTKVTELLTSTSW